MRTVYYADCDELDNARTGYHATPEEAEAAFWQENALASNERARVRVYIRGADGDDADTLSRANELARMGSPSPALDIAAA